MNRRKFMGFLGVAAAASSLPAAKPEEPKLFAILHDGHFSGDSSFYFPSYAIAYEAGTSLDTLKQRHLDLIKKQEEEYKSSENEIREQLEYWGGVLKEEVVGAVIVDERAIKAMNAIWEADPGSDSATYTCNRAAKRVAWELKVFTIGKGMY